MPKPREVVEAVREVLVGEKFDGYPPATGLAIAKEAIARRYTHAQAPLSASDVIIASGCSGALEIAISAIAHSGQALLLPQPGFSLYRTLCDNKGIQVHYYHLDPSANWEINLDEVESLIKSHGNITGWIINNPSNPCGSVYSKDHLRACKRMAAKYHLIIIADEIYEDLVFPPNVYHPMATLDPPIPLLTCSGLAKRFLVPGWRVGWILIHDPTPNQAMSAIRGALIDLAGLILGANSIMQASLPLIFERVPQSFHQRINDYVANNATLLYDHLQDIAGLQVIKPQGALYMMLGIAMEQFDLVDDVEVCQQLISEESLICLPGSVNIYLLCQSNSNYLFVVDLWNGEFH